MADALVTFISLYFFFIITFYIYFVYVLVIIIIYGFMVILFYSSFLLLFIHFIYFIFIYLLISFLTTAIRPSCVCPQTETASWRLAGSVGTWSGLNTVSFVSTMTW